MSNEILTQEEIDALLQGLGQDEDEEQQEEEGQRDLPQAADGSGAFGDVAARAAELALQATELPAEFDQWKGDLIDASGIRTDKIALCGQMEITGDTRSRSQYYIEGNSEQVIARLFDVGVDDPLIGELLESFMQSFADTLASQLAAQGSGVMDIRPGPVGSAGMGGLADSGERYWLALQFTSDAGAWAVNLLVSPGLAGADARSAGPSRREAPVSGLAERKTPARPASAPERKTQVDRAEFASLSPGSQGGADHRIDMLLDVPLQVSVELGRTVCQIRDILQLGTGAVLELEKQAGDPVDILVNGKLVARGEVVVVDEDFAVRITEIVSFEDRLKNLG